MRVLIFGILCGLIATSASAQVSFRPLGDLPGGQARSQAMAISGDGLVVVGSSSSAFSLQRDEAFRWTAAGGMTGLGAISSNSPPPPSSFAFDVSHDGSVVVGRSGLIPFEAFRWTAAGGMVGLGVLPGDPVGVPESIAWSTSANGSVVVGQSGSFNKAFRWTATEGMVALGGPPGLLTSRANEVSAEGSVIVGDFETLPPSFSHQAFRWTAVTGLVPLSGNHVGQSRANGVSAGGSVVVGSNDSRAFRWTEQTGLLNLGDLSGGRELSNANDVSADGSVIVGWGETAFDGNLSTTEAFYWTAQSGMVNLRSFLVSQGMDLTGWSLTSAEGVSADGRTIVGTGENPAGVPEGWIATIPEPSAIVLAAIAALLLSALFLRRQVAAANAARR